MMTVARRRSRCKDCGMDTTPCTGNRGRRHKERWEYYMVDDKLWARAGMREGFLCVASLENGSAEGSGLRILRVLRSMTDTHGILRGSILENAVM
jgi:hypothetical protein